MDNVTNKRNHAIDGLKYMLAALVVVLHVKTPYTEYLGPLLHVAVPAFFIISGYCIFTECGMEERLKKALRHIAWISLWSIGFFAVFKTILLFTGDLDSPPYFTAGVVYSFFVNNDMAFAFHLWYLLAYLYTLVVVRICFRFRLQKYLYFLSPVLLVVGTVFSSELDMFGHNWLFKGIPLFTFGLILAKHKARLQGISTWSVALSAVAMLGASYAWFFRHYPDCNYILRAATALLTVCWAALYGTRHLPAGFGKALGYAGMRYSLLVYVFHPFVSKMLWFSGITSCICVSPIALYAFPIIVLALTTVLAAIIDSTRLGAWLR